METTMIKDRARLEFDKFNNHVDELIQAVNTKAKGLAEDGKVMGDRLRATVTPVLNRMIDTKLKKVGWMAAGLALVGGITALVIRKK